MGREDIAGAVAFLLIACAICTVVSAAGAGEIFEEGPYHSWLSSVTEDISSDGDLDADEEAHPVITVCQDGCNYTSIQAAVNGSSSGDIILVSGGTYPESLVVNKSLDIRGVNGTVLVGAPEQQYGAEILSDMVYLRNLTFTNAKKNMIRVEGNMTLLYQLNLTTHDPEDFRSPVIQGRDIDEIIIGRCQIATTGTTGISLGDTAGIFVINNLITTGEEEGYPSAGIEVMHGSATDPSSYMYLCSNTLSNGGIWVGIENGMDGLSGFSSMDKIRICHNTITGSIYKGIHVGVIQDPRDAFQITNVTVIDNQIQAARSQFPNLEIQGVSSGEILNNTVHDFPVDGSGAVFSNLDKFLIQNNSVSDGTVYWPAGKSGFLVEEVQNSVIRENCLTNVLPFGFDYAPGANLTPNLTFDQTNTADGKPVWFLERSVGQVINQSAGAAMVVLLSCTNITVENTVIRNSGLGIGVYESEGTVVAGNQILDTNYGMMLINSCGSHVEGNQINGSWMGMGVGVNRETEITQNNISHYLDSGIVLHLVDSSINITRNTFTGDFRGTDQAIAINEAEGDSVLIIGNNITHSTRGMLLLQASNFTVIGNDIQDSGIGFNLIGAQDNIFFGNRILNDDPYSEGLYVVSSSGTGGGISRDNEFVNNYIQGVTPVNITTVSADMKLFRIPDSPRWGPDITLPVLDPAEDDTYPNVWNITRTAGTNIVNGPYLGGNFYATPDGSGWSQTHADRGDGFVNEPYLFDRENTDYLPLHKPGSPTPTPTCTPTPTPTPVYVSADFNGTPVCGTPPLTVQFTDTSSGMPTSWNWTFGDGAVSHEQNPVHVYTGIGRYTVTLEIANSLGESIMRKPSYITPDAGRVTGPNGMIWVTSSPTGAQVYTDGTFIGETPLQSKGIPAGVHQIRVSSEGYRSWTGYVQVSQGVFSYVPKVVLRKDTPS